MADINEEGLKLLYGFEGRHTLMADGRYKAYLDKIASPPVWTLYAGLTKGIKEGMTCTEAQGDAMVRKELNVYEDAVERLVTVELSSNEFSALVVLVYNIGVGAFQRSTLLKVINQGKRDQIPTQWLRWNKAGGKVIRGLERRRKAELVLFLQPDEEVESAGEPSMPQRVEENKSGAKEATKSPTIWGAIVGLFSSAGAAWQQAGVVASDTTAEVVAKKQSLTGFEALWSHFGISLGSVLLIITVASLGIVLTRHITRYVEGRA